MVNFENQPKGIIQRPQIPPPPKPEKEPQKISSDDVGSLEELMPELSETPVIDNVQANADVPEPDTVNKSEEIAPKVTSPDEVTETPISNPDMKVETAPAISFPKNPPLSKCRAKPLKSNHGKKKRKNRRRSTGR